MTVRQAAVAGTFYPDSANALNAFVTDMMNDSEARDLSPKVLVVPHAGYVYSGTVAASAYRLLEGVKHSVRRVVLLGPAHRVALEGMAIPDCDAFSTPLGDIPLDAQSMNQLTQFSQVQQSNAPHAMEHSLEVQCPFLQLCLEDFQLTPILVGDASPLLVAEVIDALWGGDETLIVISTDLSHFHNYEEASYRDNLTVKAIEQLSSNLTGGQACGCHPLNGMMKVAQRRGMEVITLDVRNSGDTAGDKNRVVGYGSFVIQ